MKNMSVNAKKALIIIAGILLLVLSYFLVFQANTDQVDALDKETSKYNRQIRYLETLQMQNAELEAIAPQHEAIVNSYTQSYPCKVTQQNVIYTLYQMLRKTHCQIKSISTDNDMVFFKDGKIIPIAGNNDEPAVQETATVGAIDANSPENNPEQKVPFLDMVGNCSVYAVDMIGTKKQLMKAFEFIATNKEKMALTDEQIAYDSSTGKLSCQMKIRFYSMNGNGVPYKEPNVSDIVIGSKDVFGSFDNKSKK